MKGKDKSKTAFSIIIFLSLLSTIIFGFVDSLLFFFAADTVQAKLIKWKFDLKSAEILTSALSTALAIFVAIWIEGQLSKYFDIIQHPVLSSIGILLGALIFVAIYKIVLHFL